MFYVIMAALLVPTILTWSCGWYLTTKHLLEKEVNTTFKRMYDTAFIATLGVVIIFSLVFEKTPYVQVVTIGIGGIAWILALKSKRPKIRSVFYGISTVMCFVSIAVTGATPWVS